MMKKLKINNTQKKQLGISSMFIFIMTYIDTDSHLKAFLVGAFIFLTGFIVMSIQNKRKLK